MSLDGAYDPANIFAKIVRGEAPAAKLFEDDATLAFLDAFPQARGHALAVHKTSTARNLLEVERSALERLILTVQRVALAIRSALNPEGIVVTQFNGALAGQSVYHLHFHIIPRWPGEPLGRHGAGMADPVELAALAKRIAAEIS
ncbi:MAG TPA: HIT domain-containing protein [Caulobacteraceae bacterium]